MNQSNSTLAKRIAELERQLSSTKDLLESSQLSEATAKQYAEEVDKQNQALAAQVQALRDTCSYWIERSRPEHHCTKTEFNTWLSLGHQSNAMTKSAQHHLRQVRADSVMDAANEHEKKYGNSNFGRHMHEYAASILSGKE